MEHWCQKCSAYTRWVEVRARSARSYTTEKCETCERRFPCRPGCGHLDCEEHRGDGPEKTLFQRIHEAGLDKPKRTG